jgi:hypothetical protein
MARRDRDAHLALLERQLRVLGPQLAVPDAGGVAVAVRRRIESGAVPIGPIDVPTSPTSPARRRVLVGIAVVLVLVVGLTLAIGRSRDAVADWLGLRGVEIERSPEPVHGLGSDLQLGRRVSLTEALDAVGFEPLVAARAQYRAPDAVYLADTPAGGRVTFAYAPRAGLPAAAGSGVGLLITEFEATIDEPVLRKTAGPDTTIEVLEINGQRAYWLAGEPHAVAFTDRDGKFFEDESRLAGNTLLFASGPRTVRIESGLTKAEAIAVAEGLERSRS